MFTRFLTLLKNLIVTAVYANSPPMMGDIEPAPIFVPETISISELIIIIIVAVILPITIIVILIILLVKLIKNNKSKKKK